MSEAEQPIAARPSCVFSRGLEHGLRRERASLRMAGLQLCLETTLPAAKAYDRLPSAAIVGGTYGDFTCARHAQVGPEGSS